MVSRRKFLGGAAAVGLVSPDLASGLTSGTAGCNSETASLDGVWQFRLDPDKKGDAAGWHGDQGASAGWNDVNVPHTWQVSEQTAAYQGVAWYRREFHAPASWAERTVRIEFEAVYHTATVWLNGQLLGTHAGKGYTSFEFDVSAALKPGARNVVVVRVDNSFSPDMLPRGSSFDWTMDGGIYRPVQLLVTPRTFIERVDVDAVPSIEAATARIEVRLFVRNSGRTTSPVSAVLKILEEDTGRIVLQQSSTAKLDLAAGHAREISLEALELSKPRLWHFDHPHLYRAEVEITATGQPVHSYSTVFGIRKIEVRGTALYFNGERVRLMGVERMAGSNPEFGMAEPEKWLIHDHSDMKELNCVFTRVHWAQDKRTLEYCDRNGILIQLEVPSWGPGTFKGMGTEPVPEIMQNGLEQLREMIRRDRNHPSVFAWGLCNEVDGQNPAAKNFARRLFKEAKTLDPNRLCTYASNSLSQNIGNDVSAEMDFVSWNEYYGSWMKGDIEDLTRNLEAVHRAFPNKMIVISEYGYCECRPEFTGGDPERIKTMHEHTDLFRRNEFVGGAIFFCYNDYRTHIGDKGTGALKQRVHGVVDLYGDRKPSFDELRRESSPVEALNMSVEGAVVNATVRMRNTLPSYIADGYSIRCIAYGHGDLPMESHEKPLPKLVPGQQTTIAFRLDEKSPRRIKVDVMRPTRFSALTADWRA